MQRTLSGLALLFLALGTLHAADSSGVVVHPQAQPAAAPAAPSAPAASAATRARYGLGAAKLPPPPARACITEAEFNEAMLGSGCDCSCEGYAGRPESRCQVACGHAYYACWAPDPTEAEIRAAQDAMYEDYDAATRAALEAQQRQALASDADAAQAQRAALMLARAAEWADDQRCPPAP